MSSRNVPGKLTSVAIVAMVLSFIGFIVALVLNTFVLDDYDAYGEVAVPGSGTVHLLEGKTTISLHTMVIGSGGGLPVPKMSIGIVQPDGAPEPVLTEDIGTATTVNSDAHIRVWYAQIPVTGDYHITTSGNVNGYINPTLAFGHESQFGYLTWTFVGIFVVALVVLFIARKWAARVRKRDSGVFHRPSDFDQGGFTIP